MNPDPSRYTVMGSFSAWVDVVRSKASIVSRDLLDTPAPGVQVREQDGVLTGKAWMDNWNPGLIGIQQVAPISKLDLSATATKVGGVARILPERLGPQQA